MKKIDDPLRTLTFKKRKGTTDVGKEYENLFMADVVFSLMEDNSIDDFHVWSNDDDFGSFDDVIIETSKTKCALQLKHAMTKERQLTLQQFLANKGDFSIQKYFQSFQDKKATLSGCKLILFTNRAFHPEVGKKITVSLGKNDDQQIDVIISKPDTDPLKGINVNGQNCFQFQIVPESSNVVEDRQTFFANFFVYPNQKDVKTLEKDLLKSIKQKFSCRDEVPEKFVKFFDDWNLIEGTKEKLCMPMIKQLLALCLVSRSIYPLSFDANENKNYEILQRAISKFNVTIFDTKHVECLQKISEEYKSCFNTKEASVTNRNYQLTKSELGDLSNEASSKLLWLMDKFPLILDDNPEVRQAINLCGNKNYILLTNDLHRNFENSTVFQTVSDLKIHEEIFNELIVNFKLLIAGTEINLAELLKNSEMEDVITTNDLLLMTTNDREIRQETEKLPVPYISRKLSRNFVDFEFLNQAKGDTLVLITNVCDEKRENILAKHNPVHVNNYLKESKTISRQFGRKPVFLVSENNCTTEIIQEISDKSNKKVLHHFNFCHEQLEWVKSIGDISDLWRFRLVSKNAFIDEEILSETNFENNIQLIVGDPGLGKSSLMKSLNNRLLSDRITTLITPYDIKQICLFFKKNQNVNDLNEHILKLKYKNWSRFDYHAVNSLIETKSVKVVFLWDALDEIISDNNREVIIQIIQKLSERGIVQLITCRQHLRRTLESKFVILSKTVIEFNKDQQVEYSKERLQCVNLSQDELNLIITKIVNNVTLYRHRDILSIPLQIYMLTEIFIQNNSKIYEFTEGLFPLGDLYEHFVDEKINFYYKKNPKFEESDIDELNFEKSALITQFEAFSLKTILAEDVLKELNINTDNIIEKGNEFKFGFVTKVDEPNSESFIKFAHISYAEYFVARYFSRRRNSKAKIFIFKEKYTNIRYFFDFILAKNCPVHCAVLCNNLSQLKEHEDKLDIKDAAGRNPLQLACSWGQRYEILELVKDEDEEDTANFHLELGNKKIIDTPFDNLNMIDMLTAKCDVYENDQIFQMNAINYAEATDNLFALAAIEENCHVKLFNSDNYSIQCNILYFSVLLEVPRFRNLFQLYLNCFTIGSFGKTLLHVACEKGSQTMVEFLISLGIKIDAVSEDGDTPLIVACLKTNERIIELLIGAGANVNASNKSGDTPLIHAFSHANEKIIRLLINEGANINASNIFGEMPLIRACFKGNEKIVELLINLGANIHVRSRNGDTPLSRACFNGNEKVVQLLITAGVNINTRSETGNTPLLRVCGSGNQKIVSMLIKAGADVNISNDFGTTPLTFACAKGKENVVELLVNAGANMNVLNHKGITPLIIACDNGNENIAEMLINAGCSINASIKNGDTALIRASFSGNEKIVELLIKAGANIDAFNHDGMTPLLIACDKEYDKIVELLINAGVN